MHNLLKLKQKLKAEFSFHPETVVLDSVLHHKPSDCIRRVTILHMWNWLPPFAHYKSPNYPPFLLSPLSASFLNSTHFSPVFTSTPFSPPKNSSLLHKFLLLFSIASSHLLGCLGFLCFGVYVCDLNSSL